LNVRIYKEPKSTKDVHEKSPVRLPAVQPAAAKQSIVAGVGVLPALLTITRGSSPPVARPIAAEKLYFAFW